MEKDCRKLKLGIFYKKSKEWHSAVPRHEYTFEIGTAKTLERSHWEKDAVSVGSVSLSGMPTKVRRVLESKYQEYMNGPGKPAGNPACGQIIYKVYPDALTRTACAINYQPRQHIHSEGERKQRTRPGIGSLLEYLSLSHLVPNEKVTHVSIYDALQKAAERGGNASNSELLYPHNGYFATVKREAQLRSKRIDPKRSYPARQWLQKLRGKRLVSRRPTRFVTSQSRRSV